MQDHDHRIAKPTPAARRTVADAYFYSTMAGGRVEVYEGTSTDPAHLLGSCPFPATVDLAGKVRWFGGKATMLIRLMSIDGEIVVASTASGLDIAALGAVVFDRPTVAL